MGKLTVLPKPPVAELGAMADTSWRRAEGVRKGKKRKEKDATRKEKGLAQ